MVRPVGWQLDFLPVWIVVGHKPLKKILPLLVVFGTTFGVRPKPRQYKKPRRADRREHESIAKDHDPGRFSIGTWFSC